MNNEPVVWKAYEEVHFNDQYILRWVREGDDYVNRITKEMMEDLKSMLRQQQAEIEALKAAVCSFFNDYLDRREESDSGRVFAPIYISNCRCMTLDPMSKLMNEMRELSGAKPPPKMET